MSKRGKIALARAGNVVRLTIERPHKHNALDLPMIAAMSAALDRIARDKAARVLIVAGAGGASFSAGADLDRLTAKPDFARSLAEFEGALQRMTHKLKRLAIPTIAALRGFCMGGGVQVALGCDLRFAAGDLALAIPAVRMGLVYPRSALADLVARIGAPAAKLLLWTASPLDARAAARLGLVDAVFPVRGFARRVDEVAATIARQPPVAVKAYKRVLDALARGDPATAERVARRVNRGAEMFEALRRLALHRRGGSGIPRSQRRAAAMERWGRLDID